MKIDPGLFWRSMAVVLLGLVMASAQAKPPFGDGWGNHDESTGERWSKHRKPTDGEWVKHDKSNTKLKDVLGMDDKLHTASCSGYPGTDPEFSFWSKKGKSKNLAVFFEGGGACWDKTTCSFPISDPLPPGIPAQLQFFVPAIDPASNPADYRAFSIPTIRQIRSRTGASSISRTARGTCIRARPQRPTKMAAIPISHRPSRSGTVVSTTSWWYWNGCRKTSTNPRTYW